MSGKWIGVGAASLVLATVVPAAPANAEAGAPVVLAEGHVDVMSFQLSGGALEMPIRDDTGAQPVDRSPDDVLLRVLPEAEDTVPNLAGYEFLGEPGSRIWRLWDFYVPGLLWPGWSSEAISSGSVQGDSLTLSLLDASGPGEVAVFFVSIFGDPDLRFHTGAAFPQSTSIPARVHAHPNWVFTAAGTYTLTWQADAVLSDGTAVSTGPVEHTWLVGEQPDPPPPDGPSQIITATVDPSAGALIISVDPQDRTVVLPPAVLSTAGDRWQTQGPLRPVTVTDSRASDPGWTASGQVSDFTVETQSFPGGFLGWSPQVTSQAPGQHATPGTSIPSGLSGGAGIADSATLASAPAGAGRGTAVLGAELVLELPTQTLPGVYEATLTLTVI